MNKNCLKVGFEYLSIYNYVLYSLASWISPSLTLQKQIFCFIFLRPRFLSLSLFPCQARATKSTFVTSCHLTSRCCCRRRCRSRCCCCFPCPKASSSSASTSSRHSWTSSWRLLPPRRWRCWCWRCCWCGWLLPRLMFVVITNYRLQPSAKPWGSFHTLSNKLTQ